MVTLLDLQWILRKSAAKRTLILLRKATSEKLDQPGEKHFASRCKMPPRSPKSTIVQPRDDESGCDTPLRGPTFPSWSEWQLWSDYHCIRRRIDRLVWADDNRRRHGPKLHPVPFQPELCPHPSEVVFGNRAVIMLGAAVFQQLQPADYLLPPCHAAYRLTRGLAAKGGYRRVQRFAIVPVQVFLHELTRDLGSALPPANWTI